MQSTDRYFRMPYYIVIVGSGRTVDAMPPYQLSYSQIVFKQKDNRQNVHCLNDNN